MPSQRWLTARAVGSMLILAWAAPSAAQGGSTDPEAFIRALGNDTIAVLREPGSSPEERKQHFRELLSEGLDLETIARLVLGRYWRAATPEQQSEYVRLLPGFILEAYAVRLDDYAGETFEILKVHPLDERNSLVRTEVRSANGPAVRVDYLVRARNGAFKILDVMIEGVSLLRAHRSEFASVINRQGVDGLLALLRSGSQTPASANR
ncbi:MAG: phospholipid-binding protein MlaC [Alphaproteobacteria bacterium]